MSLANPVTAALQDHKKEKKNKVKTPGLLKRAKRAFKLLRNVFKIFVMDKLKTLITTYQMLAFFGVTYRIDWPEAYEEVVEEVTLPSPPTLPFPPL